MSTTLTYESEVVEAPVAAPVIVVEPSLEHRGRRGRWERFWRWVGASAVAYPGGGIVHLALTQTED